MLSIVIPALDEEKCLPSLLKSIKNSLAERIGLVEIIVADANSKDRTVEIAKNQNCKVVKGGLPSKGRNEGTKIVRGDLILFLDADTILPENFFEKEQKEFEERDLDVASFCLEPQSKNKLQKFLFNVFYNLPILILERELAHASQAILVKKALHQKIGGFDEAIKFAEDHTYVRKAKEFGKFGILKTVKVLSSLRRFEKDGWIRTYLKYLLAEIYMIIFGDIKKNIFQYKFNHYK